MKIWRSASSQDKTRNKTRFYFAKKITNIKDREELGVLTSRNGHICQCQQKRHCSLQLLTKDRAAWRSVVLVHHAAERADVRDSE